MVTVKPSFLKGNVSVVSSKSAAHRAIIAGGLMCRSVKISNADMSNDIRATLGCLQALGVSCRVDRTDIYLSRGELAKNREVFLDAEESGSTLRFFIPICAALGNKTTITGSGRLPERPLDPYFKIFEENGIKYQRPDGKYLPLTFEGSFVKNKFSVPGNISSQFITGLLLAAAVSGEETEIEVTGGIESRPYIDMTVDILEKLGCSISGEYKIKSGRPSLTELSVEKDWSQAAFFLCAGIINGCVTVTGMNPASKQGDREIVDIIKRFGGKITISGESVTAEKSEIKGIDIDAKDIPDLVPVLSVLACYAKGTTRIYNAARLRIKESDRLHAMQSELSKLGADIKETSDGLVINGKGRLSGGSVCSHNDHRVVMSMAAAAAGAEGDIIIDSAKPVEKSYPRFFEDYNKLKEKSDEA